MLCERAEARARERGATSLTLWVLEANQAARRFYERRGFVADGTRKTDEASGQAEIRYGKVLTGA